MSLPEAAIRNATYADLEAVHPHLVAEIIHGALVTHPRPVPGHVAASSSLGAKLIVSYQHGRGGPGDWVFLDEPELHLGANVVVPDIAGWRRERLQPAPAKAYIETPPDWVCEIISPSTEIYDKGPKRQIYADAGVSYLWLLDPRARVLEAFQLAAGNWLLQTFVSGTDEVKIPPFDAAPFSLGLLWPFDEPLNTGAQPKT